jgi:hypothetical protein
MSEFLDFIFYFFVGLIITKICLAVLEGFLRKRNEEMFDEITQVAKELTDEFILVNIEKHGDVMYLFEKHTNRFIAQGKTKDEIQSHCSQRFPGRTIVTDEEQAGSFNL